MKKVILSTLAIIASIPSLFGQEVIKLTNVYEDPSSLLVSQFIVEYEGQSAADIKSSVEKWAASAFVDVREVEMANGDDYVVYKPLLTYSYDAGMGVIAEGKITAETKFEFKDGRVRVTITEVNSRYVGQYGSFNTTTKDQFKTMKGSVDEIVNKGMYKPVYRRIVAAIERNSLWIQTIKSIKIESYKSADSNW